jgi:hypothetical protein
VRAATIAITTYNQPKMLGVWMDTLRIYPEDLLAQIEFVVVDDCGETPAEIPKDVQDLLPVQLFQVTKDVPWNQPMTRNLAAHHVRTPWIIFADVDMVFDVDMLRRALKMIEITPPTVVIRYTLQHRVGKSKGLIDISSPNTWIMRKSQFDTLGGYHEDFVGHKGWSDCLLLETIRHIYKIAHPRELYAQFFSTAEIPDAAVTTLDRNTKRNKYLINGKLAEIRKAGGAARWVKNRKDKKLRLPWIRKL